MRTRRAITLAGLTAAVLAGHFSERLHLTPIPTPHDHDHDEAAAARTPLQRAWHAHALRDSRWPS